MTRWPDRRPPTSRRPWRAVRAAIGRAAACSKPMLVGLGATAPADTATRSARPPSPTVPKTSSPTWKPVTFAPTASTTPATSEPRITGRRGLRSPRPIIGRATYGSRCRKGRSYGLRPTARPRTRICPSPATGGSTSVDSKPSGPPYRRKTRARILSPLIQASMCFTLVRCTISAANDIRTAYDCQDELEDSVVNPGTDSVASGRERLSMARVLRAAITMADESGLDGLTMRRLARSLGSEAMSLYYYVKSRDALLDEILDAVVGEIGPVAGGSGWKDEIRQIATSAYEMLERHPWAAALMMSPTRVRSARMHFMEIGRA